MKDTDALLKNLYSLYKTVVMLDREEALWFICLSASLSKTSVSVGNLAFLAVHYYIGIVQNSGLNSEQFPAAACAGQLGHADGSKTKKSSPGL